MLMCVLHLPPCPLRLSRRLTGPRFSCTVSTDLATAVDRCEVTDGDLSTLDIAGIVSCGRRAGARLPLGSTDDELGSDGGD